MTFPYISFMKSVRAVRPLTSIKPVMSAGHIASVRSVVATAVIAVMAAIPVSAQNSVSERDANLTLMTSKGWEWQINAGINIGGAAPLGMPRELRKIHSYKPGLNTTIEGKVVKWWGADRKWGTSFGVKFEDKAMKVSADVKNYHTEIIRDNDRVSGYWTGYVNIDYGSTFLTIPVAADYRFNDRWRARAGLFWSYRLDGNFSGFVRDGYLRSGIPTGEKIVYTDGNQAAYEFNDDLRKSMCGAQIGGSWRAYRHFSVNADLTYSFKNIFRSGFTTVKNTLHPLFFNIGFGYTF